MIRNILGQVQRKVSFQFMVDDGRVFIANLSKGRLGHDKANLVGSLLVTQFQLAAMARAKQPENERRDFFLFIDEFQNFTTDAFASLLAEARKYRLCLTLSHQYVDQLSLPIRQAVLGNVGSTIAFRVGQTDAAVLEKEYGNEIIAKQFVDLNRYEVLAKLMEDGQDTAPFRGVTMRPLDNRGHAPQKHIHHSRMRFATPRTVVEQRMNRWMQSPPPILISGKIPRMRQNPRPATASPASRWRSESAARKTIQCPATPIPV